MNPLSEVEVIWRAEVARALTSGRVLVLLVLFGLVVTLTLLGVGYVTVQLNARMESEVGSLSDEQKVLLKERFTAQKKALLGTFVTGDEAMLDALAGLPVLLLITFGVTLRFVPAFVALMGFDQLAGEVGPRSIRYVVVRSRRSSIVLGKFLSQATVFGALLAACTLLMVGVARALDPDFALVDVALWTARLLVASFVLALAYLALTTLCSASFRQSAVALAFNVIILFVLWTLSVLGAIYAFPGAGPADASSLLPQQESVLAYLRYTSVWHFSTDLLHPHWPRFLTAVAGCLGFALVFLGTAQVILDRRDV